MANKKINELVTRTPSLSDLILVGDPSSGYSYKATVTALATIIETDIADGFVTLSTTQTISGAKTFSNNLTLTSVANTPTDPDKFLTLNASNVVTYRTGAEVLSDIGGQGTLTLTTTGVSGAATLVGNTLNIPQYQAVLSGTGIVKSTGGTISYLTDNSTNWNSAYDNMIVSAAVTGTTTKTLTLTQQDSGTITASWTDDNSGTVTSVGLSAGTSGTDVNVSGSPITSSGTITLNIPTASATNRGALSSTDWSTFNNKQSAITLTTTGTSGAATLVGNTLNIPQYTDQYVGTVTSVAMTVPTGLTVSGTPITSSGTLAVSLQSGYSIPTTASQANWDSAYNDKINSAAVTGTTTKTLTLTQQDGGTVTASWTDDNTDAVTSVFGRTGAVVATEGDYSLTQLSDVTITSPSNGQVLKYNGTTWVNDTDANTGTVTSVGLSAPTGFSVTNSPVTSSGTLTLSFASGYSLPTTASQTNWDTAYTNRITSLTTTGSSGAATLVSNTLNIPNYTLAGLGGVSGSGTTNYIPKFTSSSAIGNSQIFDNGSNVGINIASPAAMLDVNGAGLIRGFLTTTDAIKLGANTSAPTSTDAFIYRPADNTLAFGTASSERLRISSTGNVSIGNTNNTYKLDVTGDARINNLLWFTPSSGLMALGANGTNFEIYNGAGAETRLTLTNSGNLGIGTSAPDRKLVIQGAFNSNEQLLYLKQGDNNGFSFNLDAAVTGNLMIKGVNSGTETSSLLTIRRDNGNTGIGTSSPAEKLDVYDNSASNVSIKVGNTSGALQLLQGNGAAYLYTATNQPLIFSNNNSEKMRLDASGNLGLGVSPASWYSTGYSALQVRGLSLYSAAGNDGNLVSNAYLSTAPAWTYLATGTATRYEQSSGSHKWYNAPSGTAGNAISFTQAMTLDASGRLLLNTTSSTNNSYYLQVTQGISSSTSILAQGSLTGYSGAGIFMSYESYGGRIESYDYATSAWKNIAIAPNGGSIGIGTSSPAYKLDVNGEINAVTRYRVNAATQSNQIIGDGTAFSIGGANNLGIRNDAGSIVFASGGATVQLQLNTSGNLGLGVTPSAWSTGKAIEVGALGNSIWGAGGGDIALFSNAYYNSNFIYASSNYATGYRQQDGVHKWLISSSGTAGNAISFTQAMTLDASGNLSLSKISFNSDSPFYTGANINSGNNQLGIGATGATVVGFFTNSSERMRITSGGDVGIGTTTANSKLHVAGSLRLPLVTKSATYTLDATDYTVGFDCTGANRTANLPDATTCSGRIYVIYQFGGGSTYGVTIDGNSSQTINGSATYVLQGYCDYSSVMIQSDGSNWVVISDALQTGCL